ncbi:MAG: hypothetical protein PVF17_00020 [Ignavibacteria bacterium]|jgi:hypothetical protein
MDYLSNTIYKNRYNDQYRFTKNSSNSYKLEGNLAYFRHGFEDTPDNIIFIDPSGGPFLHINNFSIDDNVINTIINENNEYLFYFNKG